MKTATISELKQEFNNSTHSTLVELCLRLAKYKKDNKELLAYLLFEAHDEHAYINSVKADIDSQFTELPKANLHLTKKSLRKILRTTNKYIRYTASKQAEVELLIHFSIKFKGLGISMPPGNAMYNLYQNQLKKINKTILLLHEDLQHDYKKEIAWLSEAPEIKPAKKGLFGKWK